MSRRASAACASARTSTTTRRTSTDSLRCFEGSTRRRRADHTTPRTAPLPGPGTPAALCYRQVSSGAAPLMVDPQEQLSHLIGDIYDAALDPALWVSVLETTCRYLGGATSALQSHDVLQQNACFY